VDNINSRDFPENRVVGSLRTEIKTDQNESEEGTPPYYLTLARGTNWEVS